ncbi:MAG: hypothetical protein NT030_08240 [Candidatus Saganbacteria bacterium]|nr:hypothetical protein [Candidatus Saganbacteria bacterium]
MKRTTNLAVILISIFVIAATLAGCGSGAKESGVPSGTNKGTITGYVYDASTYVYSIKSKSKLKSLFGARQQFNLFSLTSKILSYTGAPGVTVMVGTVVATTDANGVYTITGIPSGTVAITAFRNGYKTMTLVVNSDEVNLLLVPQASWGGWPIYGTGTITGSIEHLPDSVSPDDIITTSLRQSSDDWSYTSSTHSYNIDQAPDSGEAYVIADFWDDPQDYSAYGRVDMSGGGINILNLDFNSISTIEGNIIVPSGFSNVGVGSSLYNLNNDFIWFLSNKDISGSYYSLIVPQLLSGDSFAVGVTAYDAANNEISKADYNITGTSHDFDLSSLGVINFLSPTPTDEANLNGELPTFSWSPVSGSNIIYLVWIIEDSEPLKQIWDCYTKNTSITFPSGITGSGTLASGKHYEWRVHAYSISDINMADMTSYRNSRVNTELRPPSRYFTF